MIAPILFVDEKTVDRSAAFRFEVLRERLKAVGDVIEFMGDLDLEYEHNIYTDEVIYQPNPTFAYRKTVFIHTSLDSPKYPEPVVNKAKSVHSETIFAKFSNGRDPNPRMENLIFNRDSEIYNFDLNGFEIFVRFFYRTDKFEFHLIREGRGAFLNKIKQADITFNKIQDSIKTDEVLARRKGDANFATIMRLANVYGERLEKGRNYIEAVTCRDDYFHLVEKYVKSIKKQAGNSGETEPTFR